MRIVIVGPARARARLRASLNGSMEVVAEFGTMRAARAAGLASVGLAGRGGGKLAGAVDLAIVVPSDVTARIQESHIAVIHSLCALVDALLFPEPGRDP